MVILIGTYEQAMKVYKDHSIELNGWVMPLASTELTEKLQAVYAERTFYFKKYPLALLRPQIYLEGKNKPDQATGKTMPITLQFIYGILLIRLLGLTISEFWIGYKVARW